MESKKMPADERRKFILRLLKSSGGPVTGREMAEKTNVSRQVIVGDISLLRAKGEPIIATSQGYLYIRKSGPEFENNCLPTYTGRDGSRIESVGGSRCHCPECDRGTFRLRRNNRFHHGFQPHGSETIHAAN